MDILIRQEVKLNQLVNQLYNPERQVSQNVPPTVREFLLLHQLDNLKNLLLQQARQRKSPISPYGQSESPSGQSGLVALSEGPIALNG